MTNKKLKLEDIIAIANTAYNNHSVVDNLVVNYFNSPNVDHGDTLAEFIVKELKDSFENAIPCKQLESAARVMDMAIDDLLAVRNAFQREMDTKGK